MNHVPGLMIVVDARREKIAVAEAAKLGIPIISIIDTNADPDPIDFPIAGNDDAIKSIRVLLRQLVDAAVESQATVTERSIEDTVESERQQPLTTYSSAEETPGSTDKPADTK